MFVRTTLLTTALLGTTAFGIASAAPLGPQATLGTDGGLVTHVKKSGTKTFNPNNKVSTSPKTFNPNYKLSTSPKTFNPNYKLSTSPKTFNPNYKLTLPPTQQPPPPKGGKYSRRPGGGVVILGGGDSSCDVPAARCAGLYGTRTLSYRRCLRLAGC